MADVSQAQSRLARAKSALSEAEAFLRIGEDTYTRLTDHALVGVKLAPVAMPASPYENSQQVLEKAREGNPKMAAFKEDVESARARKQQAKANYSPSIDIEAGPSYSDRDARRELFTSEFGVAAVIRWNLFNSMANVNENKSAAARIRQARQTLYDFNDELKLQVEESWTQLKTAKEQLAFYEEAVEYNLATRDAYQEQFILGQRSLLDVLDAENELFNSSSQAATANGNALIAAYRLKALTGELIPSFGIRSAILKVTPNDHEPLDSVTMPK
jgi:adhesin transport system outer membrane protein